MLGSDFATYVKRIFKRTDKDTEIYEAATDTVMDMRLRFEFDRFKAEAYSASITVAGDYKLETPSDMGHIVGDVRIIDGTSSYTLTKLNKEEFDEIYPNQNATGVFTGKPIHWCFFDEQVLFGPVPDSTSYSYEISYTTEDETAITASTADVPFSDRYRECLRYGVLARLYTGLDDDERAIKWQTLYENEIGKIISNERKNNTAVVAVAHNDF